MLVFHTLLAGNIGHFGAPGTVVVIATRLAAEDAGAARFAAAVADPAEAAGARAATELERLRSAAQLASSLGLIVHAGHGLNYQNVQPVAALREVVELNIGHAIVAQALLVGLPAAVREMKRLMREARA